MKNCQSDVLDRILGRGILLFLLAFSPELISEVKSTNGTIGFDVDMNGTFEASLTSVGFAIGQNLTPSTNLQVSGNSIISNSLSVGGGTAGSSNLNINGALGFGVQALNASATLSNSSMVLVDTSSANISVTLPYAGNVRGRTYNLKKISGLNRMWVDGGGNFIDDSVLKEVTSNGIGNPYMSVISNGSQWYITSCSNTRLDVASSNIVGWWRFDELSGANAADISGFGHTAAISGNWTSGAIDGSIMFDGTTGNYGNVGSDSVFRFITGMKFSVTFWMYPISTGGFDVIVGRGANGGSGWYIQFDNSGNRYIKFMGVSGSTTTASSNLAISNLVWSHIAVVYSGNIGQIYINGTESTYSTQDTSMTISSYSGNLYFGRYHNVGYEPNLRLDDVRIFNKALSADEVLQIYQSR